jgi:hypothetical protein
MKPGNGKKRDRKKIIWRFVLGGTLGAAAGYLASVLAGTAGSQCLILCNEAVAVPYFAVIGFLVAWR